MLDRAETASFGDIPGLPLQGHWGGSFTQEGTTAAFIRKEYKAEIRDDTEYSGTRSIRLKYDDDSRFPLRGEQEIVWFRDAFGLIRSDLCLLEKITSIFKGGGTLMLQFRLQGSSTEFDHTGKFQNYSKPSVNIVILPAGLERTTIIHPQQDWRSVDLWFHASILRDMLGAQLASLPPAFDSFVRSEVIPTYSHTLPLPPRHHLVLNDLMDCPIEEGVRSTYLEAKALELLCLTSQDLVRLSCTRLSSAPCPLSHRDIQNLHEARDILTRSYSNPPTLYQLGLKVGLNRRKLAQGFKYLFQSTVYDYCVRLRMDEARRLLVNKGVSVSEAAIEVGYKDPSSFTKAFKRNFGLLPKDICGGGFEFLPDPRLHSVGSGG